MECRASGTVEAEQAGDLRELLVGLAGHEPLAVSLRELVLHRSGGGDIAAAEVRLQHDLLTDSWAACQFGLPLRSKAHAQLQATARSALRAECNSTDVPAFWRALGYLPRYELMRQGHRFEVQHAGHAVEVSVCRVLRLALGSDTASGEELAPGYLLVEASTMAAEGAHVDAAAAVGSLAKLLRPHTQLAPLPQKPG